MCIYPFAPGCSLEVSYAAETILFDKQGSCEALVDVLVTNKSQDALSELRILYPHRMPFFAAMHERLGRQPIFEDATHSFRDQHDIRNQTYGLSGSELVAVPDAVRALWQQTPPDRRPARLPEGAGRRLMAIVQPDPDAPARSVAYFGALGTDYDLRAWEHAAHQHSLLTREESYIMHAIPFSGFNLKLTPPIEPQEPRWLRLYIRPPQAALDRPGFWAKVLDQVHGTIPYYHQVLGPRKLCHRIEEAIEAFKKEAERDAPELSLPAASLGVKVLEKGLKQANTVVRNRDWRINLIPSPGCSIVIQDVGPPNEIRTFGGLPNVIPYKFAAWWGKTRRRSSPCYQFRSTSKQGDFLIGLELRVRGYLGLALTLLALLLAFLGVWSHF